MSELTYVGNVFPGATLPYGLAKAVADTDSESNQGGFTFDGANITGFSSMHDSGTGYVYHLHSVHTVLIHDSGNPSLGNFALFLYAGCINDTIDGCVFPKKARKTQFINNTLKASPGYFGLTLVNGIEAEMTAAQHTSLFRFGFPSNGSSPLVLLDLTDLSDSRQDNASVLVDAGTGRMTGNGRFLPSFGQSNYVAYFCADFSGPDIRDSGIWVDSRGDAEVKDVTISRGINGGGPLPGGAFIRFTSSKPVSVRVGLSFISSDQACSNAEVEIPNFDFDATRDAAVSAWREKLKPITVSTNGVNSSLLRNFYSGVYRTMVNPQNYTGVNPIVSEDEIWFDSFYW